MKLANLYRFMAAAHLTHAVDKVPKAFSQRGGVMLVAPPEQMKSTVVQCLDGYGDCLVLTDLNVKQLVRYLRDEIASGRYNTVAMTAFEKLYARDSDTASNIEASLSAMMEEGFGHASFEDSRSFVRTAKCLIVGALVEATYRSHISQWLESGFARRFVWIHFRLRNPSLITRSIIEWNPISVNNGGAGLPTLPYGTGIPWSTTSSELERLHTFLKEQPGRSTPHILCGKILSVLKWNFRNEKEPSRMAWDVMRDVAESFKIRQGGALVDFEDEPEPKKK